VRDIGIFRSFHSEVNFIQNDDVGMLELDQLRLCLPPAAIRKGLSATILFRNWAESVRAVRMSSHCSPRSIFQNTTRNSGPNAGDGVEGTGRFRTKGV
jgi:hypothetical protein